MNYPATMVFNILIKKEDEMFIAHCMELDIVATGPSADQATHDMMDLIIAQLKYAFSNNNLDHLYRPAPPEAWQEFYRCKSLQETKIIKIPPSAKTVSAKHFVPDSFTANMCVPQMDCYG